MNFKTFFLATLILLPWAVKSQTDTSDLSRDKALKIYIDCNYCDQAYFREHFTLVSYVRDRKEADVQIIISEMETGSGGSEYTLQFLGRGRFEGKNDTLTFSLPADFTEEEERSEQLKYIRLGLVPYILKTPFAYKLSIQINQPAEVIEKEKDPWKNWVFNLYGSIYLQKEKSYSEMYLRSGFNIDKITEKIKIQFSYQNKLTQSKYRLYDGDSLIYKNDVTTKSNAFKNVTTWSLGDHWGVGWYFFTNNSTYSNLQLNVTLAPAVEYNVFSYKEATHHQLRFFYAVGYAYQNYYDTTLYNKINDQMLQQHFHILFSYVAKWGSLDADFSWENYLHDFGLYNAGIWMGTSIRLFKGLSFNCYGSIEIPRDQITLRKEASTPEEVLTRQHEMQSDYSLWFNIGLSYSFGSIYNNVVNPRFEF
jgi:hypothetical protein